MSLNLAGLLWAKFEHLRFGTYSQEWGRGKKRVGSDQIIFMYKRCQCGVTMIVLFLFLFLGQFSQPFFAAVES